jgi:hypothetical protein
VSAGWRRYGIPRAAAKAVGSAAEVRGEVRAGRLMREIEV